MPLPHEIEPIDWTRAGFGDHWDELPLWSAPFGQLILDRVPLRPDLVALDVGAGTGFLSIELAQRCGPRSRVIAVDPWAAAVERLRRKLAFLGVTNVEVLEQDAVTLPIEDGTVDVVISSLGVNNFPNADAVLHTCHRVTKPRGRLLLATNTSGHMAEFYVVFRDVLERHALPDAVTALDNHVAHRGTAESLADLVRRAGFTPEHVTEGRFRWRFADGSALFRHFFIRLGFLPAWLGLVPAAAREAVFTTLERDLNAHAAARGELALTIPMVCVDACRK